jgi:hypothetical protein
MLQFLRAEQKILKTLEIIIFKQKIRDFSNVFPSLYDEKKGIHSKGCSDCKGSDEGGGEAVSRCNLQKYQSANVLYCVRSYEIWERSSRQEDDVRL